MGIDHIEQNERGEVRLLICRGLVALNSSLLMSLSGRLSCVESGWSSWLFNCTIAWICLASVLYQMPVLIRQRQVVDTVYTGMLLAHLLAEKHSLAR